MFELISKFLREPEPELIPLSDFEADDLQIQLTLPSYAADLRLNITKLRKLMRMAGVAHLSLTDTRNGEIPDVAGIGENGTGTAEKTGGKNYENRTLLTPKDRLHPPKILTWAKEEIVLDLTKINSAVSEMPQGVRNQDNWQTTLDKEIKKHLLKKGTRHLLSGATYDTLLYALVTAAGLAMHENGLVAAFGTPLFLAPAVLLTCIPTPLKNIRVSIYNMGGIEIDRAIILYLMTKTTQLIHLATESPVTENPQT